jgi:hypothetical protein
MKGHLPVRCDDAAPTQQFTTTQTIAAPMVCLSVATPRTDSFACMLTAPFVAQQFSKERVAVVFCPLL